MGADLTPIAISQFSMAGCAATKLGGIIAAYSHRSAEIQGVSGKDRLEGMPLDSLHLMCFQSC
jgi:hypothetical protein